MKYNKLLPITLALIGLSITGCGNNNTKEDTTNTADSTEMIESTTDAPISNNINGVFDGYRYKSEDYNLDAYTYDSNYYNGYRKKDNYSNERFGDGMKGAENIKGNENKSTGQKIKSDINKVYNAEKNMYNNIKNDMKDVITN